MRTPAPLSNSEPFLEPLLSIEREMTAVLSPAMSSMLSKVALASTVAFPVSR